MRKRALIQVLSGIILFSGGALFNACNFSANSEKPKFVTDSMVAHFDNFTYKGEDDFYKKNTLPGEDYFYNPILPGWYSDPSLCTNGEDYFMVTSTFSYFPGVPLFHSKDLLNWKQIGHILNRPEQLPLDGQKVSEGIFAPTIRYNPHNQTYYMITTNIHSGNFFVKTKDPFGKWSDPVWLPNVHGIDPSFFFDDNGKAYIVNNDEPDGGSTYNGHRAIRIIEFDVKTDKTIGSGKILINGGVNLSTKPIWIEGPHLYKINGNYLLMCAEGGTGRNHREVIFKGNSPMGKFVPWCKNPILTQKDLAPERPLPITCAGHADLIQKDNGQWWAVFLACRPIDNRFENLGRETFLMPVRWSEDGLPFITQENEIIPRIIRMEGVKRNSGITFGNFEKNDDFSSAELGMDWMTLRGNAQNFYSLTDNPGFLTLKCAPIASNELQTPAYIGRRLQHHKFECTTTMYFSPHSETESAGMLLMKDEEHQYLLVVEKKNNKLQEVCVKKIRSGSIEKIRSRDIKRFDEPVKLKISSDGCHFNFYYAHGNQKWNLLADKVNAAYLSTNQASGFTGTTIGLYASSCTYKFN